MLRLEGLLDGLLRLTAFGLLISMLVAALHDVSQAWDVWYYHLPFGARLWGLVPQSDFIFTDENGARFSGFPLLGEWLQGLLWRLTRIPTAANLVAFSSVPAVAVFLRIRFGVPLHLTVVALLAIPLVQTHATSCYVDLPANSAVAVLVMLTLDAYARRTRLSMRTLLLAFCVAALAANMKCLLHPLIFTSLVLFGIRFLVLHRPARVGRPVLVMLVCLPVVFASPLKNLILHQNPYYPLRIAIAGHDLPGRELPYASSPMWLRDAPRPLRFAASVSEIGARPLSDRRRWTVDQWTPSNASGYRMGGFFGAYVLVQLIWLVVSSVRARSRETNVAAIGFASLTAIVALMPQSHELRYYMVWMIVLASINLWHAARHSSKVALALGYLSAAALAMVLVVTHAGYVYPSGLTFAELVQRNTDETQIAALPQHAVVCVAKAPYSLLWAAAFHPPRHYVVREAEHLRDCGDATQMR